MSEIALRFLLANFAAACAILVVMVLRKPVRAAFGARIAYALWLLAPLAALGSLLPPRFVEVIQPAPTVPPAIDIGLAAAQPEAMPPQALLSVDPLPEPAPIAIDPWTTATLLWLAGGIAMFLWQMRNQSRFMADARAGFAGPAVAGFLRPRIITPSDFEDRFDRDERQIIIAHETIHLRRNDARINALVALLRCICWFNPLVHLAAHLMRIDQEIACDAAVVEHYPRAKAVYASALLKAQLAARPLPLGCYWPAGTEHPLTERVEMLKQAAPGHMRSVAGASALAILALCACAGAWSAMPPKEHFVATPAETPSLAPVVARAEDRQSPYTSVTGADSIENRAREWLDARVDQLRAELRDPGSNAPQPTRPEPQQAPTAADMPAAILRPFAATFDVDTPIYLRGVVEKIDFADTTYVVFVRAENIATDPYALAQPNSQLWALNPANYFGDPDNRQRIHNSLANKRIDVFGYRAADKSCTPACLIQAREMFLQPTTPAYEGGFGGLPGRLALDAVIDTSAPIQLKGTVVRFDNPEESATPHGVLWVEAESVEPAGTPGAKPGTMWRVAGFPGYVLQSRFWQGAHVTVNGFNVRDKSCEPACVMAGKQIF